MLLLKEPPTLAVPYSPVVSFVISIDNFSLTSLLNVCGACPCNSPSPIAIRVKCNGVPVCALACRAKPLFVKNTPEILILFTPPALLLFYRLYVLQNLHKYLAYLQVKR